MLVSKFQMKDQRMTVKYEIGQNAKMKVSFLNFLLYLGTYETNVVLEK